MIWFWKNGQLWFAYGTPVSPVIVWRNAASVTPTPPVVAGKDNWTRKLVHVNRLMGR